MAQKGPPVSPTFPQRQAQTWLASWVSSRPAFC